MTRAWTVLLLLARFLRALVMSGLQTLWIVARSSPGRPPPVRLIRMRIAPLGPTGATLLGCLITLTPGTTTLDVDLERDELLLHVLDASDPDAVVDGIRHEFEDALVTLFAPVGTTGAAATPVAPAERSTDRH